MFGDSILHYNPDKQHMIILIPIQNNEMSW